jgi:hypothetical protein
LCYQARVQDRHLPHKQIYYKSVCININEGWKLNRNISEVAGAQIDVPRIISGSKLHLAQLGVLELYRVFLVVAATYQITTNFNLNEGPQGHFTRINK